MKNNRVYLQKNMILINENKQHKEKIILNALDHGYTVRKFSNNDYEFTVNILKDKKYCRAVQKKQQKRAASMPVSMKEITEKLFS